MNGTLSEEAREVGAVLDESLRAAGGLDLLRRAVDDPQVRGDVAALFEAIGLWGLRPLADQLELEVAAEACRIAGRYAAPYPLAERLAGGEAGAVALVADAGRRAAPHADLDLGWSAVDLAGRAYKVRSRGPIEGGRIAAFVADLDVTQTDAPTPAVAALLVTLQSWWLLGLVEQATSVTAAYAREREQFGRPIIAFQAVGFQLADMAIEVDALRELAAYTTWALAAGGPAALPEAIGLRLAASRAARVVLAGAHQVHGAMGFTDEVGVSWLSRASQPYRLLPEGEHATGERLARVIAEQGWSEFGLSGPPTEGVSSAVGVTRVSEIIL